MFQPKLNFDFGKAALRPATRPDLPFIISIMKNSFFAAHKETPEHTLDRIPPLIEDAFKRVAANPFAHLMIFEHERVLRGTFQIVFIDTLSYEANRVLHLDQIRVHDTSQERDLSRLMFQSIHRLAVSNSCAQIQLNCKIQEAQSFDFYRTLGFSHSHQGLSLKL